MKKIVGIVLGLAVVVAIGFTILRLGKTEGNAYARFLPPDVVGTVNLSHGNTLIDNFAASPLGKVFTKDTIHAIVQEMGGQSQGIAEYDRVYDAVAKMAHDPAIRAVFGDDATLALLPPDRKILADKPAEALRDCPVVIARTSVAGALDMLSRLMTNAQISRETVDGLDLVKIGTGQGQVFYGYTQGQTVFLALSPAAIKACLAAGKGETALDKAPAFKEAAAFWQTFPEETTYFRTYFNTPAVAELLQLAPAPEIKEAGEMLAGVGTMYSIDYETSQGMESRGRAGLTYDRLHSAMKNLLDAAAKGNQTLHLLQEQVLAYNWAASLQTEQILTAMAANEQEYQEVDRGVQQNLGVSLQELVRAFGPRYGAVLDDIVHTPLFPWPKMILFVEIRDRAIAEKALNGVRRLVADQGISTEKQEQVEGLTVYSWPIMPGEAQPAAVLTADMLYLSTSKQALKTMLAVKRSPNVLAAPVAAQVGQELSTRLQAANFSNFIVFPARMARQVGETVDWLGAILASSKHISLERFNRELVQLMQSTELVAVTSQVTKERVEWAATIAKAKKPAAGAGGQ
ncbi:MAG: DUF3352 domain-containing protein [Desulfobulbus sp.]|nr:DUF3352 domain-containing protein [Desulfobulbus sp.]